MNLTEIFKEDSEEKYPSVVVSDSDGNTYYSDEYVEWLESKLEKVLDDKIGNLKTIKKSSSKTTKKPKKSLTPYSQYFDILSKL